MHISSEMPNIEWSVNASDGASIVTNAAALTNGQPSSKTRFTWPTDVSNFYDTLNSDDASDSVTVSNFDLRVTSQGFNFGSARSTFPKTAGKWYVEMTANSLSGGYSTGIGVAGIDAGLDDANTLLAYLVGSGGTGHPTAIIDGVTTNYSSDTGVTTNQKMMMAIDFDAGKGWFGVNGTWLESGDPASGGHHLFTFTPGTPLYVVAGSAIGGGISEAGTMNFGATSFTHTVPSGFSSGWYVNSADSFWLTASFDSTNVGVISILNTSLPINTPVFYKIQVTDTLQTFFGGYIRELQNGTKGLWILLPTNYPLSAVSLKFLSYYSGEAIIDAGETFDIGEIYFGSTNYLGIQRTLEESLVDSSQYRRSANNSPWALMRRPYRKLRVDVAPVSSTAAFQLAATSFRNIQYALATSSKCVIVPRWHVEGSTAIDSTTVNESALFGRMVDSSMIKCTGDYYYGGSMTFEEAI